MSFKPWEGRTVPQPRSCPGRVAPSRASTPAAAQVGVFALGAGQEEGGGGQRLCTGGGSLAAPPFLGPPGKPCSGQGGQRAGCLDLAGQLEPRLRVAEGRVAEPKPR